MAERIELFFPLNRLLSVNATSYRNGIWVQTYRKNLGTPPRNLLLNLNLADFWATVCKTVRLCYQTVVLSVCPILSCLSVCDFGMLRPNGWMDQYETWHGGWPWLQPHCVRLGPSCPLFCKKNKGAQLPSQFSADVCCGQTVVHLSYC